MSPPPTTPGPRRFMLPRASEKSAHKSKADMSGALPNPTQKAITTATPQFTKTPKFYMSDPTDTSSSQVAKSIAAPKFANPDASYTFDSVDPTPEDDEVGADGRFGKRSEEDMILNESKQPKTPVAPSHFRVSKKLKLSKSDEIDDRVTGAYSSPLQTTVSPAYRYMPPKPKIERSEGLAMTPEMFATRFIEPPIAVETQPPEPLPTLFSPHRKAQKYLQIGLAATMRAHIMDATTLHSQHNSEYFYGTDVTILECSKFVTAIMVKAKLPSGADELFLLAGHGKVPTIGESVHIKGVNWLVEIQNQKWTVCVDWSINA